MYDRLEDKELRKMLLRYNAKLYLKGLSILSRCKIKKSVEKNVLFGDWVSIRMFVQSLIFTLLPKTYAFFVDKMFLK